MLGSRGVWGGCSVAGAVGKIQPQFRGRACWAGADMQTGLGQQGGRVLVLVPAVSQELKCCCSTKGLPAPQLLP